MKIRLEVAVRGKIWRNEGKNEWKKIICTRLVNSLIIEINQR